MHGVVRLGKWSRAGVLGGVLAVVAACAAPAPVPGEDAPLSSEHTAAETISISRLPLPPTAPNLDAGSCGNSTGCLDPGAEGIAEGPGYMHDGAHVLVPVRFGGGPDAPDPAHVYSGDQVIVIKTDGASFPNGDPWKCITCGVPDTYNANKNGHAPQTASSLTVDHPQAFRDGTRVLLGTNILDCGPHRIVDEACTAQTAKIFPITPYRSGASMRELRLHPDGAHLGFSEPVMAGDVYVDQFAVFSRLRFEAAANRYVLEDIRYLVDTNPRTQMLSVDPENPAELRLNEPTAMIGEFRGFTDDGMSALGIGTVDSGNFDLFTTDLASAASRRWTQSPAYTDPADMSPDGQWMVYMDGRVNDRMFYAGALPGVPPLIDMVNAGAVQFMYNNGTRRFFQPYLASSDGAGAHGGQQLNACDDPFPGSGSICDPLWNGRADPTWSPDSTRIVYWQAMVEPPACGTGQPTAPTCPQSTEPGGRKTRLMMAELLDREPQQQQQPPPFQNDIPWAVRYQPGSALPTRPSLPAGSYTLNGRTSGHARVTIAESADRRGIARIDVTYTNFSDDDLNTVDGTESATAAPFTWHANLSLSGLHSGSRRSSEPSGFVITPPSAPGARATVTGALTTILDGKTYTSPGTGQ